MAPLVQVEAALIRSTGLSGFQLHFSFYCLEIGENLTRVPARRLYDLR